MGLISGRKKIFCKPYEKLAGIYDFVMNHVNYAVWTDYVTELLKKACVPGPTLFDISCGTGNFAFQLLEWGYRYFGMDYSAAMIVQARKKMALRQIYFPAWVGDMQNFSIKEPVDAVLCLYDSINYLTEGQHWQRTLRSVSSVLKPNGIFIFDITTIQNSLAAFRDLKIREDGPDFSYDRKSYYDRSRRIQWTEFWIRFDADAEKLFYEKHFQQVYPVQKVVDFIRASDFNLLGYYSDFTLDPGSESANRVHFVLQKSD